MAMTRKHVACLMLLLVSSLAAVIGLPLLGSMARSGSAGSVPVVIRPAMGGAEFNKGAAVSATIETAPFEEPQVVAPTRSVPSPADDGPSLGTKTVHLSGVVIDTEGTPLAAAEVSLLVLRADAAGGQRWSTRIQNATAGSDGRFAFTHSALDARRQYAVIAESERFYQRDVVRVTPGARDVEIELVEGSTMQGSVVGWQGPPLASAHFDRALSVVVRGLSGAVRHNTRVDRPAPPTTYVAEVNKDGTFSLHGLPPGSASVSVEAAISAPPLVRYEGVPVPEQRPVVDPRIQPIDLRGAARWATITVRDPRGAPRSGVMVRVFVADGSRMAFAGATGANGRWAFPVGAPVRVGVGSPNTAWASLEGVDGDREVVLGAGMSLTVRFVGAEVPTTGSPWILATLEYLGPAAAPARRRGLALGRQCVDGDPLRFLAPGAGRYRVGLTAAWTKQPFG